MTVATKGFTWVVPTTNVDGTAIVAGEITGYSIGVRPSTSGAPGTYPVTAAVGDPAATSEAITALGTVLAPGSYAAAIQTIGPVNSVWSSEITFDIAAPPAPVPNPPANFSVT